MGRGEQPFGGLARTQICAPPSRDFGVLLPAGMGALQVGLWRWWEPQKTGGAPRGAPRSSSGGCSQGCPPCPASPFCGVLAGTPTPRGSLGARARLRTLPRPPHPVRGVRTLQTSQGALGATPSRPNQAEGSTGTAPGEEGAGEGAERGLRAGAQRSARGLEGSRERVWLRGQRAGEVWAPLGKKPRQGGTKQGLPDASPALQAPQRPYRSTRHHPSTARSVGANTQGPKNPMGPPAPPRHPNPCPVTGQQAEQSRGRRRPRAPALTCCPRHRRSAPCPRFGGRPWRTVPARGMATHSYMLLGYFFSCCFVIFFFSPCCCRLTGLDPALLRGRAASAACLPLRRS